MMKHNADFSKRVVVHSQDEPWVPSPMQGVDRRMLDRIGGEVARATSIVRYAPGSKFSAHTHTGGEEFIVLDGMFQDEHGDYPAGMYVRNPPTTSHTPGSETGCTIFVKLWQFDMDDRNQFSRVMDEDLSSIGAGLSGAVLHEDERETVSYFEAQPNAVVSVNAGGGSELLVLDGTVSEGGDEMRKGSWLRLPDGMPLYATAGPAGAKIWLKTGHLRYARAPEI